MKKKNIFLSREEINVFFFDVEFFILHRIFFFFLLVTVLLRLLGMLLWGLITHVCRRADSRGRLPVNSRNNKKRNEQHTHTHKCLFCFIASQLFLSYFLQQQKEMIFFFEGWGHYKNKIVTVIFFFFFLVCNNHGSC